MTPYSQFGKSKPPAKKPKVEPNPNDRADDNFIRMVPSGNTTEQKAMPPAGPYHVNHFICYFKVTGATYTDVQAKKVAAILTYHFLRHFCFIFSETNIARAQHGPRGLDAFLGSKTVEFTIGPNVGTLEHRAMGFFHPDWVAMSGVPAAPGAPAPTIQDLDDGNVIELTSFHGDTLKRKWDTVLERKLIETLIGLDIGTAIDRVLLRALFPGPPGMILDYMGAAKSLISARNELEFNRQHFLAGSRSWRVGYDVELTAFFVETITIERFSCAFYARMESMHSTRDDVLTLWDHLLNNFVKTKAIPGYRFEPIAPPPVLAAKNEYYPSSILPEIRHGAWHYDDLTALLTALTAKPTAPVVRTLARHEGLKPHLDPKK